MIRYLQSVVSPWTFALCAVLLADCGADATPSVKPCKEGEASADARSDEVCLDGIWVPWTEAPMWADFDLKVNSANPRIVSYTVQAGGFAREHAAFVRVDFGDTTSGWGEFAKHTYDAPGVYRVTLEVTMNDYRVLTASRLAVVNSEQSQTSVQLTLNQTPYYLSGVQPFYSNEGTNDPTDDTQNDFHLLVAPHGFSIDIFVLETDADPVDRATLRLTADQPIGPYPAGANLIEALPFDASPQAHAPHASRIIPQEWALPPGMITLELTANTQAGDDLAQPLTFEVDAFPSERQPLDEPFAWLLRFDQDLFTTHTDVLEDGGVAITTALGADGDNDFAAELRAFGAQSNDTAPGASDVVGQGYVGASAIYLAWVKRAVVEEVRRYYLMNKQGQPLGGIAFDIFVDGDMNAPDPATFSESGVFSMMRLGGTLGGGFLGRSYFAVHNGERINDTGTDVGVATSDILNAVGLVPGLTDAFNGIKPGFGTPVGEHLLDALVLSDEFDPYAPGNAMDAQARYKLLQDAARFFALAIANVTAHEMGHAMGLMPNGPPPQGFFGGRGDVYFGHGLSMGGELTNSHHADFPGLNLMQAGGNLFNTLTNTLNSVETGPGFTMVDLAIGFAFENRLSPYERAYMQSRQTYSNFNGELLSTGR